MPYQDTTIIIPTLNEEKNIGSLLQVITRLYRGIQIIVSDDGSSDATQDIAKQLGAKVLNRTRSDVHGLTASVLDAMRMASTPFVVVIDGDFQHPPEKIKLIVQHLRAGAQIVAGVRTVVASDWPLSRKLMSCIAIWLGKMRLWVGRRSSCRDILSGYFGIERSLIREIPRDKFQLAGYKILFDILKNIPRLPIREVPFTFGLRKGGSSKIGWKHIWLYLTSLFS